MDFSKELQKEIKNLFRNDKEMLAKLLLCDYDAIRSLIIDNNISHTEILEALDPENETKKKKLLKKAKKIKLYFDILDEIQNVNYIEDTEKKR